MNKIISTSDHLSMAVCGPSGCGKTETFILPNFRDLNSFHSWKTVCSSLTILVRKFSTTRSFQNLQQLDATEKLVSSTLSIICFNRVNGLEQLISTQHTYFVQVSQRYTADKLYWETTQ